MNYEELTEMSVNELENRKRELKDELFHLRIQQASGQLDKPSQLRTLRREVARISTILTQRQKAQPAAVAAGK
jgi:large subunit ribosomal protein L29